MDKKKIYIICDGAFSVLDGSISLTPIVLPAPKRDKRSDAERIAGDWYRVGDDLREAISKHDAVVQRG